METTEIKLPDWFRVGAKCYYGSSDEVIIILGFNSQDKYWFGQTHGRECMFYFDQNDFKYLRQANEIKQHKFVFSAHGSQDELVLVSDIYKDSNEKKITYQTLILNKTPNSAQITFSGCLTPENLRQLANELEKKLNE